MRPGTQDIETVLIGIGINVFSTTMPEEIRNRAGAIDDPALDRNALTAEIWKRLLYWTDHPDASQLMDAYRKDSLLIGKEITWTMDHQIHTGKVLGINDDANLIVQEEDASIRILSSGEVSVR